MFCLILLRNNNFIHHIGACHEVKLDLVKDILPLLTVNELTMKYVLSIIPKAPNRLDLDTNWYFNLETQFCKTVCIYILCHNAKLSFTYLSAAFQFGVKMQDGQNTQKQNRDQKLNNVLHQINKILTRKRWILVRVPTTMKMTCSLEGKKLRIWNLIVVLVFKRSFLL